MAVADVLPVYHHRERHALRVAATPAPALAAAKETRLEDVPVVSLLFRDPETATLVGRPWSPRGGTRRVDDFVAFAEPGYAKMVLEAPRRGSLTRILPGSPRVVSLEMATSRASPARAAVELTFEELYRGHHADVYRAALRELGNVHDAEDVTQAAFVDAYRAVLRGAEPQSPRAWMLAISENVRRRRFRTAQRRPREELLDDADFPLAAELPYEQARALAEALAKLSPDQRRVFVLREIVGLSYDEIADEVDSTVGSVQMLLFRARRSLRRELDPPVVARRKAGSLVPLPGWLPGLVSRVETMNLTPRAAGALGAAAIAVAGASVAVGEAPADGRPSPANDPQPPAAAVVSEREVAPPVARTMSSRTSVPAANAQPVTRAERRASVRPSAAAPVAADPTPATPRAPATAPAPTLSLPVGVPALERPRLPVSLREETIWDLLERPVPPPPSTAPAADLGTGAAGAAGADAPPLPVPSLPPGTPPPAP